MMYCSITKLPCRCRLATLLLLVCAVHGHGRKHRRGEHKKVAFLQEHDPSDHADEGVRAGDLPSRPLTPAGEAYASEHDSADSSSIDQIDAHAAVELKQTQQEVERAEKTYEKVKILGESLAKQKSLSNQRKLIVSDEDGSLGEIARQQANKMRAMVAETQTILEHTKTAAAQEAKQAVQHARAVRTEALAAKQKAEAVLERAAAESESIEKLVQKAKQERDQVLTEEGTASMAAEVDEELKQQQELAAQKREEDLKQQQELAAQKREEEHRKIVLEAGTNMAADVDEELTEQRQELAAQRHEEERDKVQMEEDMASMATEVDEEIKRDQELADHKREEEQEENQEEEPPPALVVAPTRKPLRKLPKERKAAGDQEEPPPSALVEPPPALVVPVMPPDD